MKKRKLNAISRYVGNGGYLSFEHGFDLKTKALFKNGYIIGVGEKFVDYYCEGCVERITLNALTIPEIEEIVNIIVVYEQWLVESGYLTFLGDTIKNYLNNNSNQTLKLF